MLTDIFATRYADRSLWEYFGEPERRLVVQGFRILEEQIQPYYFDGSPSKAGVAFWTDLHNRLSMELGLTSLSPLFFSTPSRPKKPIVTVCKQWMLEDCPIPAASDNHTKERLSLIELAFRMKSEELNDANTSLEERIVEARNRPKSPNAIRLPGDVGDGMRAVNARLNKEHQDAVDELNARFRQAGTELHYHNGFIQISTDTVSTDEIHNPFWSVLTTSKWTNVDTDMKEAFDRRDNTGRDPAWYAARALESAIKVISDEKGWSTGKEKGAHNYIDRLASKRAGFIVDWERDLLKSYFTMVRNPFGHGPGTAPMPKLSTDQTDWAIETAMVWIKMLVRRSGL